MSIYGRTTDNNYDNEKRLFSVSLKKVFGKEVFSDCEETQLKEFCEQIAGKSLNDLVEKNKSLLVFPSDLKKTANDDKDEIEKSQIFSISGAKGEERMHTYNVMGFLGYKGVSLTISSRFYPNNDDFFLHYLLQRIAGFHVMDLPHVASPNNPAGDFLPYLFPSYFMRAWKQGVYRVVRRFERNDDRVKGNIDISRHIKLNIPFRGNIAYSFSERSADNPMTRLIRLTVDVLEKDSRFKVMFQEGDKSFRDGVMELKRLVGVEAIQNVAKVVRDNLKPVAHPFYSEYKPLQRLCLAILRHKRMAFAESKETIHGVLFRGEWLWEEYLARLLMPLGITHAQNHRKTGGYQPAKNAWKEWYPDFYKVGTIVLDAKYKWDDDGNDDEIRRADKHQIIAYMYILKASTGGFIYPGKPDQPIWSKEIMLNGWEGTVYPLRLPISRNAETYERFVEAMRKSEEEFQLEVSKLTNKKGN